MNINQVECPKCGGIPEYDELGMAYVCFYCYDVGFVPAEAAAEFKASRNWERYLARESRIINAKPKPKPVVREADEFDEIFF